MRQPTSTLHLNNLIQTIRYAKIFAGMRDATVVDTIHDRASDCVMIRLRPMNWTGRDAPGRSDPDFVAVIPTYDDEYRNDPEGQTLNHLTEWHIHGLIELDLLTRAQVDQAKLADTRVDQELAARAVIERQKEDEQGRRTSIKHNAVYIQRAAKDMGMTPENLGKLSNLLADQIKESEATQ